MVVALGGAGAVQRLALGTLQRVGFAGCRQPRQRAVDGGEPDARVRLTQLGVQRLGAHETSRVGERIAHAFALPGVPLSHASSLGRAPVRAVSALGHERTLRTRPRMRPASQQTP